MIVPSSETQGQIVGTRESLNGRKNIYGTKKSKERWEEPLGTMSYQTSSKRSPPFWLLIGARKPFGTGLVRHCPQGLFSPFFTFLRVTFFRPFRLFLVPTICPRVSEDVIVPAYPGRVVPLEFFMARKFVMGFFGVLFEAVGIFWSFDFCPHSIILSFEIRSTPLGKEHGRTKQKPFEIVVPT